MAAGPAVDTEIRRGLAAVDYRESRGNVMRRLDRGDTPETCRDCGTELDVETPAHSPSCSRPSSAAALLLVVEPAPEPRPAPTGTPDPPEVTASIARALERAHADDFDLEICGWCCCEVDVDLVMHRPGCEGIGKPRVSAISDAVAVALLAPVLSEREPMAREASGVKPPVRIDGESSGTVDVESRGRRSGAEPASRSESTGRRVGRPKLWDRDRILDWIRAFAEREGRPPTTLDLPGPGNPAWTSVKRECGSLKDAVIDAGVAPAKTSGGAVGDQAITSSAETSDAPHDARAHQVKEDRMHSLEAPPPLLVPPPPEEIAPQKEADDARVLDEPATPAVLTLPMVRAAAFVGLAAFFDFLEAAS